ncbi:hypothetical protein N7448_001938 [Penicillium atrosanguineum]|nr:hypothetical protein N7448_001938 [Penicillium atrosanguineum]
MTHQPLEVLVVGAGIAGLSVAIALGKQGHRVVILEKSHFLKEAGAAIHLPPNATALLEWLGADPATFEGVLLNKINRYDIEGDLKFQRDFMSIRHKWQAEWYLVHRVGLHNALKERALETAILHTGCTITRIDIDRLRPSITLSDGRNFEADILLGADGLNSQLRKTIAPMASPPFRAGKTCYRWAIPTADLKIHELTRGYVQEPGVFMEFEGPTRRLVAYPCSDNNVFNICAFISADPNQEADQDEGWQTSADKGIVVDAFSHFSIGVRQMIDSAPNPIKTWSMYDMQTLPTWAIRNTALLGDAAHPFQPHMGQGGAMAIEDAVSIAMLLPSGTKTSDIPVRLGLYQSSRRPRVEMILNFTRMNGRDDERISRMFSFHSVTMEFVDKLLAAEMVKFMEICVAYNEMENCTKLLEAL